MKNLEERHVLQDYNNNSVLGTKKSEQQTRQQVWNGPAGMRKSSITTKSNCTLFSLCYFGVKGVRQRWLQQVGNGKNGVVLTELGKMGASNERD